MTKITQADRDAAQRFAVDLSVVMTGTQLANLAGVLAAYREEAFEAGREQAEREVEWLQLPDEYLLDGDYQVRLFAADAIENKEHRNDAD